jgi:hypothetical protein
MSDQFYEPYNHRTLFGLGIAYYIGFALVIAATCAAVFGIRWLTAPARGKLQAREQIQSGANRIQAYNHFFDLCASVQTAEGAIAASEDELAAATTAEDKSRINTNITAQKITRLDAVNQYNADAQKDYTTAFMLSIKLPTRLDPTYTKGVTTTCAS